MGRCQVAAVVKPSKPSRRKRPPYKQELRHLQVQLVQVQKHLIANGRRLLVIFEGRDAAGKDGAIKRIVEHLSPRETRVVALGKPSDREETEWYFQRFVPELPAAGELVLFNRSWYNRAGVERVMGFCSEAEARDFLKAVVPFEAMLVHSGLQLIKYYLDISREEQARRLKKRAADPLTQWKTSPVDQLALKKWDSYTRARDEMLAASGSVAAPWTVVRTDSKKQARLNIIRDLVQRIDSPRRDPRLTPPEPAILFTYGRATRDRLAR